MLALFQLVPAAARAQGPLSAELIPDRQPVTGGDKTSQSGWSVAVSKDKAAATRIRLSPTANGVRMIVDLTRPVTIDARTLAEPDRVIVDLPAVDFRVDPSVGQKGEGPIKAFRYGLFGPKQSRMVIDTTGPVRIEKAQIVPAAAGGGAQLVLELVRQVPGTGPASPPAAISQRAAASAPPPPEETDMVPPGTKSRPVIVIDPGHGGLDPGTVATGGLLEKNVVLSVSRHLRDLLARSGRYTVVITRSSDVYVSLDQRLRISQQNAADLFISVHADAVPEENLAQAVRGASIYTLSEQASDEQARRLAERENSADIKAGLESKTSDNRGEVRTILIDLLRRETDDFSAHFRGLVAGELRKNISLSREPQRAAAFKVLKQLHSPSVLIELGYMSNGEDQKMLRSTEWQQQVASSIAAAVDTYFASRTSGTAHKP